MRNNPENRAYEFLSRAMLTEAALDRCGRPEKVALGDFNLDVAKSVSLERFDDDLLAAAKRMAAVYSAIACFENSARGLIIGVLTEAYGKNWWDSKVTEKIKNVAKNRKDLDLGVKWHAPRGEHPIFYTDMGHLVSIVSNNWDEFEPYFRLRDWFSNMVSVVEKSRNIIMHSGEIGDEDIHRLGTLFRDWLSQVGA